MVGKVHPEQLSILVVAIDLQTLSEERSKNGYLTLTM